MSAPLAPAEFGFDPYANLHLQSSCDERGSIGPSQTEHPRLFPLPVAKVGMGNCYTFEPLARRALNEGTLIEFLPEDSLEEDGLSLCFTHQASKVPKLPTFCFVC